MDVEKQYTYGHGKEFFAGVILINICDGKPLPPLLLCFLIAVAVSKRLRFFHLFTFHLGVGSLCHTAFPLLGPPVSTHSDSGAFNVEKAAGHNPQTIHSKGSKPELIPWHLLIMHGIMWYWRHQGSRHLSLNVVLPKWWCVRYLENKSHLLVYIWTMTRNKNIDIFEEFQHIILTYPCFKGWKGQIGGQMCFESGRKGEIQEKWWRERMHRPSVWLCWLW